MSKHLPIIIASSLLLTLQASAVETYDYDALGRLTKVTQDDSTTATFEYDMAGNRTRVAIAGSGVPDSNPNGALVVVPLNGFTVIVIN